MGRTIHLYTTHAGAASRMNWRPTTQSVTRCNPIHTPRNERPPMICSCCGAVMAIVRTRIRSPSSGVIAPSRASLHSPSDHVSRDLSAVPPCLGLRFPQAERFGRPEFRTRDARAASFAKPWPPEQPHFGTSRSRHLGVHAFGVNPKKTFAEGAPSAAACARPTNGYIVASHELIGWALNQTSGIERITLNESQ